MLDNQNIYNIVIKRDSASLLQLMRDFHGDELGSRLFSLEKRKPDFNAPITRLAADGDMESITFVIESIVKHVNENPYDNHHLCRMQYQYLIQTVLEDAALGFASIRHNKYLEDIFAIYLDKFSIDYLDDESRVHLGRVLDFAREGYGQMANDDKELEDIYEAVCQKVGRKNEDDSRKNVAEFEALHEIGFEEEFLSSDQEENENEKEKDLIEIISSSEAEEEDVFLAKFTEEVNPQQEVGHHEQKRNDAINNSSKYLHRLSILSHHINPAVDNKELESSLESEGTRVIPDSEQAVRILRNPFARTGGGCG